MRSWLGHWGGEEGGIPRARNRSSERIAMAFMRSTQTIRWIKDQCGVSRELCKRAPGKDAKQYVPT